MLRADFHHHINTDPCDGSFVRHSAGALIDRAAAIGLDVLAITCHDSVPYDQGATRYAADRGILLLRGMEATVDGHHVLLLNFPEFPRGVCTMADVTACKSPDAMVIAPHPFYPAAVAGDDLLVQDGAVFDAIEFSGLYTPLTQGFNRRALEHARKANLPVVGNSDTHFLWQLGRTYTLIDAAPEPAAVLEAVRRGRVRLVTQPLSWVHLMRFILESHSTVRTLRDSLLCMLQVLRRTRVRRQPAPYAAAPVTVPRTPESAPSAAEDDAGQPRSEPRP